MKGKLFSENPQSGDIVLIPFPFTDLSSHKVRPALVISGFKQDVTVALITSQDKKGMYCIPVNHHPENGLKQNSNIVASNITTLDSRMIFGSLGALNDSELKSVKDSLKKYLGL